MSETPYEIQLRGLGHASYYYSSTRLGTHGTIRIGERDGSTLTGRGYVELAGYAR
jgi:predicted secreted hydrolase